MAVLIESLSPKTKNTLKYGWRHLSTSSYAENIPLKIPQRLHTCLAIGRSHVQFPGWPFKGLTLASQWKSQFDDSEETTDNEWKGENLPSPEHRNTPITQPQFPVEAGAMVVTASSDGRAVSQSQGSPTSRVPDPQAQEPHLSRISEDSTRNEKQSLNIQPTPLVNSTNGNNNGNVKLQSQQQAQPQPTTVQCLNIAGIENFPELQAALPRAWSLPDVTAKIRAGLEPPLLQQAAFNDVVYAVDVMRSVATRSSQPAENLRRPSLPNMAITYPASVYDKESSPSRPAAVNKSSVEKEESSLATAKTTADEDEVELRPVSGRLEIRVVDRSNDGSTHTMPTARETRRNLTDNRGTGTGCSPVSPGKEEPASVYFDATEENSKAQHSLSPVPESNRLVSAKLKSMSILQHLLMHYMSPPQP
uniref:Uncharacterized protein n=1 Tax=Homalodisca liturata TaxID=320908 RepID=A0A1B6HH44_9HEMI